MSLLDVIRSGVKTIDKVIKPLQTSVTYVRVTARDSYGAPTTFSSPTTLKAIVDFTNAPTRNKEGITVTARATLTMLDVAEIVAKTGGQGVDTDDEFTLADGSVAKVLSIGGFMDAGTYKPIPTTVMLG